MFDELLCPICRNLKAGNSLLRQVSELFSFSILLLYLFTVNIIPKKQSYSWKQKKDHPFRSSLYCFNKYPEFSLEPEPV